MKKILVIATLFVGAVSCSDSSTKKEETVVSADSAVAETTAPMEAKMEEPAPPMDSAAMMKAWENYMTPGPEHQWLAKQNGTWKEEITMWMAEGAPAEKQTATATNKMIMNGLYQHSTHKGMMNGMPFEGVGITGYDNAKKKYVSTWYDNMGSGIMFMEGTYDSTNNMLTLRGSMTDPMNGKVLDVRETFTVIDDKTQMMEMYSNKGGKEVKMMEIKFTKM